MPFRLDTATTTLRAVMDALARDWPRLDPANREQLQAIVGQHAREIAAVPASVFASRLVTFLQALWDVRVALPSEAVRTLASGQGVSQSRPPAIDPETRQYLLASVLRVIDPRYYQDASGLAEAVSLLIRKNQDRLSESDRAAWRQIETAFERSGDAEAYLSRVTERLNRYPAVSKMMEAGKTWDRTDAARGLPTVDGRIPKATISRDVNADLNRYANVVFPSRVLLGQKLVPLIVHVAAAFEMASIVGQDSARVTLRTGELTIVLHPDDFHVVRAIGGRAGPDKSTARTVQASADRDCEPVIFFVNPTSAGRKRLSVDVYQQGRNVGSLAFQTEVANQASLSQLANVQAPPAQLQSPSTQSQPADLELRVLLSADRRTLSYILHSPAGSDYNFKPVGQVALRVDPRDVFQRYVERLNRLSRSGKASRPPAETQRAMDELSDIGANLYAELFPSELKHEYRRLRHNYVGKSLLITSDEPWIPWELIRPVEYDDNGGVLYDDPFLSETLQVCRWLAGRGAPDRAWLQNGAIVAPADNLAAVQQEVDYFVHLYRQRWDFQTGTPLSTVAEVERSFADGRTQLYHFACHGNFDTQDPNESKLKLVDGLLRASQMVGARQAGLRRAKPLVFLNACYSGNIGFTLTGLGGWAERFLESGATAFVGTLWEINDGLAARFAVEFYNRLWGVGDQKRAQTLGQAFHGARMAIRQLDPANPTWLAYVLYGDPRASILLGKEVKE